MHVAPILHRSVVHGTSRYPEHLPSLGACFPGGSDSKKSARIAEDLGLTPGSGRYPGERTGYPLQYSCLENSMKKGASRATVHGVTKSWT